MLKFVVCTDLVALPTKWGSIIYVEGPLRIQIEKKWTSVYIKVKFVPPWNSSKCFVIAG